MKKAGRPALQTVVLMGGLGTRLGSDVTGVPKSMMDVRGKPFFLYQLELLKWQGFKDFIFLVGFKKDAIESFFGDGSGYGVNIRYSYDGDKLLGTGGALRKAFPALEEDFMLIYGDSYMDVDYGELLYRYDISRTRPGRKALMAIFKNMGRFDRSNVIFKDGGLLKYNKKAPSPEMEYIDYGISIINKDAVRTIPENTVTDLSDVYTSMADKKELDGCEVRKRFYEIGTPESLEEFGRFISDRALIKKPAIFVDRDGTLNEMVYNGDISGADSPLKANQLKLLPSAIPALKELKAMGYRLIVVTNQPAAAKGKTTLGDLYAVNHKMQDLLAEHGIEFDDILMCPHHPEGGAGSPEAGWLLGDCDCRKPKPGMIRRAMEKFNIDIGHSYFVGDSWRDVGSAKEAGVTSVLVDPVGPESKVASMPDLRFKNILEFASFLKNKRG